MLLRFLFEEIIKATSVSIKSLYEDQDIAVMLQEVVLRRCIGFTR